MAMRIISFIIVVFCLLISTPSFGADVMERTYRSTVYGGITGALVGGAVMALTSEPDEHLDYVVVGAASGIIFGAVYGFLSGTRATHVLRDANYMEYGFNAPTISQTILTGGAADYYYGKKTGKAELVSTLNIVRYGF